MRIFGEMAFGNRKCHNKDQVEPIRFLFESWFQNGKDVEEQVDGK